MANMNSADLTRLIALGADLQAADLPDGYKLTRKQVKVKGAPNFFVWHISKRGFHIDANGNIGDKWDPNSSVHHASIADALDAYDKHMVAKARPGYDDWLK